MLDFCSPIGTLGPSAADAVPPCIRIHQYIFKVDYKGQVYKYSLDFHEFPDELLIGKYYLSSMSRDEKRFSIVLNYGLIYASKVIRTAFEVFILKSKKMPNASFGFIGEPRYVVKEIAGKNYKRIIEEDTRDKTKRFKLYKLICSRDINPDDYFMYVNEANSCILMINESVADKKTYIDNVGKLMRENYHVFED